MNNKINNFKKLAKKYNFNKELEDIGSFHADVTEVKYIIL